MAPPAAPFSAAHLVIHTERDPGASSRPFEFPLRRLRAMNAEVRSSDSRSQLSLRIDNLQGIQMHAVDDAGSLIDVPLPAGTYHVTVQFGKLRRRYTMTLEAGASFDLHVRLAPEPT